VTKPAKEAKAKSQGKGRKPVAKKQAKVSDEADKDNDSAVSEEDPQEEVGGGEDSTGEEAAEGKKKKIGKGTTKGKEAGGEAKINIEHWYVFNPV